MPADMDLVGDLPLFSGVGRDELDRLLQFSTIERYPPATLLFETGERPDKLHVIISGTVEIFSNGNGREWGVMLMNAGDIFMPGAVLFDEPYATSARTLRTAKLLLIDGDRLRREAASCPALALQLGRAIAAHFGVAVRQVLDLKSRTAAQRLGSFLLKLADTSRVQTPELPMPKRNLAARVGMTPETLSRTLQVLADNGLVVRGRQIIVRDRQQVERFCGPEPCRPEIEGALDVRAL